MAPLLLTVNGQWQDPSHREYTLWLVYIMVLGLCVGDVLGSSSQFGVSGTQLGETCAGFASSICFT